MITRAWSTFEIDLKSINEDARTFEGIASTPSTDRMDDIVEPMGAEFKLPIPLKWQHGKGEIKDPVGWVHVARPNATGIPVKCQIAKVDSPPSLKDELDRAWAKVKSHLMRGLSIGFRGLKEEPIKGSLGIRYKKWEWLELSVVDIPANAEASILTVKSFDSEALAASGKTRNGAKAGTTSTIPGVSGTRNSSMQNITEKIQTLEDELKTKRLRMDEIVDSEEADEKAEYVTLAKEAEVAVDRLASLRSHAKAIGTAVPVKAETKEDGTRSRGRIVEQVKSPELPKGHAMARQVICLINGREHNINPAELARKYYPDTPQVEMAIKATIAAGDTTTSGFASQLVQTGINPSGEFIELLRPATLIGRIPGLNNVPANVSIPIETGGATFNWVAESAPKPVSAMTFSAATVAPFKAAGIVVITKELAKFSSPKAEEVIKNSMVKQCTKFLDEQFITDTVASTSANPASILNGKAAAAATGGTTAGDFEYDLSVAMTAFVTSGNKPSEAVILLSETNAYNLSLMRNSLSSAREFPDLTINGGFIGGIPVVVSQSVGSRLVVIKASEILVYDDGGMDVSVSDQASVEMSSTPIAGEASPITGAVLQSFWQRNLIGIRVERFISWKRARASSVEWISGATYAPANPA